VDNIYGTDDDRLEEVVVKLLAAVRKTVAVAESCTGGVIANRITNVSGASKVSSTVVSHTLMNPKHGLLGVRQETLNAHGAVSEEVAAKWPKVFARVVAPTFGISTTGIAGPTGGSPEKPVGSFTSASPRPPAPKSVAPPGLRPGDIQVLRISVRPRRRATRVVGEETPHEA